MMYLFLLIIFGEYRCHVAVVHCHNLKFLVMYCDSFFERYHLPYRFEGTAMYFTYYILKGNLYFTNSMTKSIKQLENGNQHTYPGFDNNSSGRTFVLLSFYSALGSFPHSFHLRTKLISYV